MNVTSNRTWFTTFMLVAILAAGAGTIKAQTLVVATWGGNHDEIHLFAQARGINVEVVQTTGGDPVYFERMVTLTAAGTPPDVMFMKRGLIGDNLQEMGILEDLNPWIDRDPAVRRQDHHPDVMQGAGERFLQFLPQVILERVIGYNLDELGRSGVAEPRIGWNFEDFRVYLNRLTRRDPDGTPQMWGHDDLGRIWPYNGPMAVGYFNEDGTRVTLDNPATIEGYEFFHNLVHRDAVIGGVGVNARCENGLSVNCVWGANFFVNREGNWGLASLPEGPGGRAPLVLIEGYAIHSQSTNKELAWEFLKWMDSDEAMIRLAERGVTPAKIPIMVQYAHHDNAYRDVILDTLINGRRWFAIPQGTRVPYSVLEDAVRVFTSGLSDYWRNEKPLRQLLDETVPTMQRIIDQWLQANPS